MRIIADAHPWQADAIRDPHELVSMRVGRGGAKTTTERARAIIKLVTLRDQRLGYAATSADQARDLNWAPLIRACDNYGIRSQVTNVVSRPPDVTFTDAKMLLTCHRTNSVYKLRGVEDRKDAEKFRGFPQAEFQIDEAGSFPPELLAYLIGDCVQPRIGEALNIRYLDDDGDQIEVVSGGCVVMGSTPPAQLMGIFFEATKPGGDMHRPYSERAHREAVWSSHSWTLRQVVELEDSERFPALLALWTAALKRKADNRWGDDNPTWRREYLGEWTADNTTTVFRLDPTRNIWRPSGDRMLDGMLMLEQSLRSLPGDIGECHYVVAIDAGGTRDPYACNVFALGAADPMRRMFHVFGVERHGMYARQIAQLLLGQESVSRVMRGDAPEPFDGVFARIGWPSGIVVDGDQALIDELANVYGISAVKADRRADYKFGAIELVNSDLVEGKILVIEGSALHAQMAGLQWRADEYGRLKEHPGQPNHCTDCLIYAHRLVASLYESGHVTPSVPPAASDVATPQRPSLPDPSDDDMQGSDDGLLSDGGFADYDYDSWGNA